MRSRAKAAVVLGLAAVAALPAPASAAGGLGLARCEDYLYDVLGEKAPTAPPRCGALTVPLTRDAAGAAVGGRRLRLAVRLLPPKRGPVRETVVSLAGGPGQAATPSLDDDALRFRGALAGRRLVAFDQRGTGGGRAGGVLTCPSLKRDADSVAEVDAAIAACAKRLGPARASYATADSVADLEALRVALGAPKLTLYGTSYGTKVALDYASRFPDRVERLVLDSVVPQSGVDPFLRSSLAAMPRVLRQLCADGTCPFTADAGADLAALVAKIGANGPLAARWYDRRGRAHALRVTRETLLDLLIEGDTNPLVRAPLPAALHSALDGDSALLARLLAPIGFRMPATTEPDDALYLATRCADGALPWPAGTPVGQRLAATDAALAALPAGALAPFDAATLRADGIVDYCRAWPEAPVAQPSGPLPDVPALVLAGGADLRTPQEDALALARQLPRAQVVTAAAFGHAVLGWDDGDGCATRALKAFLNGGAAGDCARQNLRDPWPVQPTVPDRFAELPARRGSLPPRVARTVAALESTFADLEWQRFATIVNFMDSDWDVDDPRQAPMGWGGLRGGRAFERSAMEFGSYTIERYTVAGGVRVSGSGRLLDSDGIDERYRLRVVGGPGARGVVTIDGRRIRGRLGGRRIDLRNRARGMFVFEPDPSVAAAAARLRATAAAAAADLR